MNMTPGTHQSSVDGATVIKQEPVEADSLASPKQEIEYISLKEEAPCLQEWEVPDDHESTQDPLSIITDECSPSEDIFVPSSLNIEKTEDLEDGEEAVSEDDGKELKHEAESTSSGSEPESTITVGVEDDKSNDDTSDLDGNVFLAAGTGKSFRRSTKKEAACGNKKGTRFLVFKCDICNQTFAHLQKLKEHTHTDLRELLYSCNVCHKTFRNSSNFKRHLRVHTGERPYSCGVCNNTYKHSGTLKKHLRRHTGIRQYSCNICLKKFPYSSDLRMHLFSHKRKRP